MDKLNISGNDDEMEEFDIYDLGDDYDEKTMDDEPQFVMEAKAFERVGGSGRLSEFLEYSSMTEMGKKGREVIPLEDRFLITVDALCRQFNEDGIAGITENDINDILEKAKSTPERKYKNPATFILGYIASSNGKNDKKIPFVLETILPKLSKEFGIEPADVVRYTRYWNLYL